MSTRESEKREPFGISSDAVVAVRERGGKPDLAVVAIRVAAVATLTGRLVEPAGTGGVADHAHDAVTALALHRQIAVRGHSGAHDASQAARVRTGMAAVTGGAVAAGLERQVADGVGDRGVQTMHGGRQRRNAGIPRARHGFGKVAGSAEDRLAVLDHRGIQAVRREPFRSENDGVLGLHFLIPDRIVKAQDVEAIVACRVRIPHPAGRRQGRRTGAGGVTKAQSISSETGNTMSAMATRVFPLLADRRIMG